MTRPILIIRHPTVQNRFYDVVTDWARKHMPACADLLDVQNLPYEPADGRDVRLLVIWLQDPIEAWSPQAYAEAEQLAAQCDRLGIPVINRVSRSSYLSKSNAAPSSRRQAFAFHTWRASPARKRSARIFADCRSRCACAMIVCTVHRCRSRITRGSGRIVNDCTKAQELYYISQQDPHHQRFQRARRALGPEMCAFDYGYDANGDVVVWEVNPFPFIQFAKSETLYRNRAIHRSVAAMLAMYLSYARLPIPSDLADWVSY